MSQNVMDSAQEPQTTNNIKDQVVRREEAWSDTLQELDPTTNLYFNLLYNVGRVVQSRHPHF